MFDLLPPVQPADLIVQSTAPTAPALVYIASLQSANSRHTMRRQLDRVAVLLGYADCLVCPWHQLGQAHIVAIQSQLAGSYASATVNLMLAAVRGVMLACWRVGLINAEQLARTTDIKALKGNSVKAATGRMLTQNELNQLLQTCNGDSRRDLGLRDASIIACAYALGLRRAEIVALDVGSVAAGDKGAFVVTILGKGNKTRVAYLTGNFAAIMRDWLALRGASPGALFPRWQKGGYPTGDSRMTTQAIFEMFLARARQSKIAPFSPHDLRRSCISHHLAAGTDIAIVAAIVGHASVQTTARYDRRGERAKQEAANNLNITYTQG